MTRAFRMRISWLAAAMLLFSQLAVAAFACEMAAGAPVAVMADCHEMGGMDSPLCDRHCNPEVQSQAPVAFVAAPFVASFVAALPAVPAARIAPGPAPRELLHATSPPLSIAHCCLRD
jgi:hypothetical protein